MESLPVEVVSAGFSDMVVGEVGVFTDVINVDVIVEISLVVVMSSVVVVSLVLGVEVLCIVDAVSSVVDIVVVGGEVVGMRGSVRMSTEITTYNIHTIIRFIWERTCRQMQQP
jgi:hypothetical protein